MTSKAGIDDHDDDDDDIELGQQGSNFGGSNGFSSQIRPTAPLESTRSSSSLKLDSLPVVEAEEVDNGENLIVAEDVVLLDEESIRKGHYEYEDPHQRPSLISVCYFKETHSMGIDFESIHGVLQISRISPQGPLTDSPLRKGDHLVAIDNHRNVSRWTSIQAVRYLKSCGGRFTMLFSNPLGDPNLHQAIAYKASEDERVGIVFENEGGAGRLKIKQITSWGLIGKLCALQEGDYVTSINDVPSHLAEAETAKIMVRSTPVMVSILAKSTKSNETVSIRNTNELSHRGYLSYNVTPSVDATANESILSNSTTAASSFKSNNNDNNNAANNKILSQSILQPSPADFDMFLHEEGIQPRFFYVKCEKPTNDTPLGIAFLTRPGNLQISNISTTGILWASPLRKGYDVLAMDEQVASKWTSFQAVEYLCSRSSVAIVARNPAGSCNFVVAQVTKPTPRSKIGVSFKSFDDGTLKIGRVFPQGLFAGSILNEDSEVLNINGVPAFGLSTTEAVAIVEHATDS
ncbi:MAG: hypothetical protein SGARI_002721, partial [Bacillariaceae sp.]